MAEKSPHNTMKERVERQTKTTTPTTIQTNINLHGLVGQSSISETLLCMAAVALILLFHPLKSKILKIHIGISSFNHMGQT